MLSFEPKDMPTSEEALARPFCQPVTKLEFEFERRMITKEDMGELIYRESLDYHPKMLREYLDGSEPKNFMYPSAVEHFKKQFAYFEKEKLRSYREKISKWQSQVSPLLVGDTIALCARHKVTANEYSRLRGSRGTK